VSLAASLAVTACTVGPLLEEGRAEAVRPVAAAVETARLMGTVQALVDGHAADAKVDCSSLDLSLIDQVRRPVCALSNGRARELVRQRLGALGLTVRDHPTLDATFPTTNVFADLPGTTRPDEVVLVGAHFDAFHQGADDNSSGVAAMLEVARVLSSRRFARTVRFVGFDLEELGLVGSTRFVEAGESEKVVAAIIFDCVGFASSAPNSQGGLPGFAIPTVGDFLAVISNQASEREALQVRALNARLGLMRVEAVVAPATGAFPITGNLMRSDHSPFWLRGKTALFFTDTANFRNPNYHRDTDTLDTLSPEFLTGVTRVSAAATAYWAEEVLP
jgi:hypothetical protein